MSSSTAALAVVPHAEGEAAVTSTRATPFADFFDRQWADVLGYVTSLCGDRLVAEELAQEALTRVFVRWPLLREPRPYCFRVATNLVRDHAKRSAREQCATDVTVAQHLGIDPHLLDAVRRLPPRHAEVVLLHYYADLPLLEVAAAVRRPKGTVARQLSEARALLAVALGDRDA